MIQLGNFIAICIGIIIYIIWGYYSIKDMSNNIEISNKTGIWFCLTFIIIFILFIILLIYLNKYTIP